MFSESQGLELHSRGYMPNENEFQAHDIRCNQSGVGRRHFDLTPGRHLEAPGVKVTKDWSCDTLRCWRIVSLRFAPLAEDINN
jgi:hypothetical protein